MTHIEEAIATCKYALSLSLTALHEHFAIWLDDTNPVDNDDERAYCVALAEVRSKFNTDKCYLGENDEQV